MKLKTIFVILIVALAVAPASAIDSDKAGAFAGQDMHLRGSELISYQIETGRHILVLPAGVSVSVGANEFSGRRSVIWLDSVKSEVRGRVSIEYSATVYLSGITSVEKGKSAMTAGLTEEIVEDGQAMVIRFAVTGDVFVTADTRKVSDPRGLKLYRQGVSAVETIPSGPEFVVQPGALVPEYQTEVKVAKRPTKKKVPVKKAKKTRVVKKPKAEEKIIVPREQVQVIEPPVVTREPEVKFQYPVNFAPAGEQELNIESVPGPEQSDVEIATIIGRFYIWQKQDERGGLLEMQADNAVVFRSKDSAGDSGGGSGDILGGGSVKAIYLAGDVVMTQGRRTTRADEIYYDFDTQKALMTNAVMRNYDPKRDVPLYVKAARLRQLAKNRFGAENVVMTSSEFYEPQMSLTASSVIINDTSADGPEDNVTDSSYDAQMRNVRLKAGKRTFFYWPYMRSNLELPDVPLKSARIGYDSDWGTMVETRWYLARLLGLREPDGVDSTFAFDYYGKRGVGSGFEIDYGNEESSGRVMAYLIKDSGKDDLGRDTTRENVDPPRDIRGRFSWMHRHFLPRKWQLTTAFNYASDRNFIESYFRNEFNVGVQESYLHLKHIDGIEGVSILGKGRINDFSDELEEYPSVEYHLTGKSLFDDMATLYSNTQVSNLRQRIGNDNTVMIDEDNFGFVSHRTELDVPFTISGIEGVTGPVKVIPFVAGTFGYDDRSGFRRSLVDGTFSGQFGDQEVWIGEAGIRLFPQPWWKTYNVESRLWDLNQLRHIVRPHLTGVLYEESENVINQRDLLNIGLSQRLQTKRGVEGEERIVDWMRLDMDATFVDEADGVSDSGPGVDLFVWNNPMVPLRVFSAPQIFNGDLRAGFHRFENWGPRRDYFGAEYTWRVSDATALLSDLNYDIRSGIVQKFDVGLSRLVWPNLSYYIGSRYLKRIQVDNEKGSNVLTFAATYAIDPRYTLVFSQQYDFDYRKNLRNEVTLIRRYHRVYCGFSYSADGTLDRQAISISIWPQGMPELGIGDRSYTKLGRR
ncbi:hypothetical protein ACFL3G_08525 [Planctomycetota bacterium]